MNPKNHENFSGSLKMVIGEIDTSAPFQSVKDAVNMFGEGAFSGEKKAKPHSSERGMAKETRLHLAQKDLTKLKEQIENAEAIKVQALSELEKAQKTVGDLSCKLEIITGSKEAAIMETKTARSQMKQFENANSSMVTGPDGAWRQDLEAASVRYMSLITELDMAKQELQKTRQNCNASMDAKVDALKQVAVADAATKSNTNRAIKLSEEISSVQEYIKRVKLASLQVRQDEENTYADKIIERQLHKSAMDELANKLAALRKDFDPEITNILEFQLIEKRGEIEELQKEIEHAKASDLDSVQIVAVELDAAKESLLKVVEEERSLLDLVESLKKELENVRIEHSELKKKESETESIAGNLHIKLRKSRSDLDAFLAEESKARGASDELNSTLNQLLSETENAKKEAIDLKIKAEELRIEARTAKHSLKEAEENLKSALKEAEETKAAELSALDQVKTMSERTCASRASCRDEVTISMEEFESLKRKTDDSNAVAEMKVDAAIALVKAIRESEDGALKKLEAIQAEIAEMKRATEEALKKAEVAEAAKRAVEGELKKWREREEKKAATLILSSDSCAKPVESVEVKRLERRKTTSTCVQKKGKSKASILSGLFFQKKNRNGMGMDRGLPSYLPGEKYI